MGAAKIQCDPDRLLCIGTCSASQSVSSRLLWSISMASREKIPALQFVLVDLAVSPRKKNYPRWVLLRRLRPGEPPTRRPGKLPSREFTCRPTWRLALALFFPFFPSSRCRHSCLGLGESPFREEPPPTRSHPPAALHSPQPPRRHRPFFLLTRRCPSPACDQLLTGPAHRLSRSAFPTRPAVKLLQWLVSASPFSSK